MKNRVLGAVLVLAAVIMIGGCAENEKREIDRLTLAKQDLEGRVQQLTDELDAKQAELSNCQDKLAQLTGSQSALQRQLEEALKQKQPPQQVLPQGFEIRNGKVMTSLPVSVLFDSGRDVLKSSAASSLNRVIGQIRSSFPGMDVYVVGFTDTDPIRRTKDKWQDNLDLSLSRSAAVTRYLVSHGLNAKDVIAAGVGEQRPVASNKSQAGKAKNRRVEFWILRPNK
jgi:chemotaxis protein MotB